MPDRIADAASRVRILVADDSQLQRLLLQEFLAAFGCEVLLAGDGQEAVEVFKRALPDLVILDIRMPRLDGIQAAIQIRKLAGERHIPIIFCTAADKEEHLQQCLDAGADDFISKPFSPVMLRAKIHSLLRVKRLYQQQYEQKRALLEYQRKARREQQIAAALYKGIIHASFMPSANLQYTLSPMSLFNGDLLLAARTPSGDQYVMLGDFTGHGLSAAIGAGPTAEIFYGMTEKGFGMGEIIAEINRKLYSLLPVDMFLAAALVAIRPGSNTLSMFNGGLPDHFLFNARSGAMRTLASSNLPLGILPSDQIKLDIQLVDVTSHDRLYLFTDGVTESRNPAGEAFGYEGIRGCIVAVADHEARVQSIKQRLQNFRQGLAQQDDITLAEIVCDSGSRQGHEAMKPCRYQKVEPMHWNTCMEFYADTLRRLQPVPMMVNAVMEIQGLQSHREAIFTIVAELFANALEHGLLALDSGLKSSAEGFIRFFSLREQRLQALDSGVIRVSFSHIPLASGGRLTITVVDSGAGFDPGRMLLELKNNHSYAGRGIALVKALCRSVDYLGCGNQVKAVYEWA